MRGALPITVSGPSGEMMVMREPNPSWWRHAIRSPMATPPEASKPLKEPFSLASERGHVVMLDVWATWCGYCRKDEPAVEQILKDHAKDGLVVLAINAAESKATVQNYLKDHPRTAQVVLTPDTNLAPLFEGAGAPPFSA